MTRTILLLGLQLPCALSGDRVPKARSRPVGLGGLRKGRTPRRKWRSPSLLPREGRRVGHGRRTLLHRRQSSAGSVRDSLVIVPLMKLSYYISVCLCIFTSVVSRVSMIERYLTVTRFELVSVYAFKIYVREPENAHKFAFRLKLP